MTTCQQVQAMIDDMLLGNACDAPVTVESMAFEAHVSTCEACARHAANVVVIASSTQPTIEAVPTQWDEKVRRLIEETKPKFPSPWLKSALVAASVFLAFMVGRVSNSASSPTKQPTRPLVVESEEPREIVVPDISIDHHDYEDGFLAGRVCIVQQDN